MVLFKYAWTIENTSDVTNLHSTMVLFKSGIYKGCDYVLEIYIPLWSYSNIKGEDLLDLSIEFTFHYGPIQIISALELLKHPT